MGITLRPRTKPDTEARRGSSSSVSPSTPISRRNSRRQSARTTPLSSAARGGSLRPGKSLINASTPKSREQRVNILDDSSEIAAEIVVKVDHMDFENGTEGSSSLVSSEEAEPQPNVAPEPEPAAALVTSSFRLTLAESGSALSRLSSPLSDRSDLSDLSALPTSLSSKATTPADTESSKEPERRTTSATEKVVVSAAVDDEVLPHHSQAESYTGQNDIEIGKSGERIQPEEKLDQHSIEPNGPIAVEASHTEASSASLIVQPRPARAEAPLQPTAHSITAQERDVVPSTHAPSSQTSASQTEPDAVSNMQHRMDGLVAMVQSESEPRMNVAPPMSTVTPTITSTAAQQTQRPLTQTPLASKPPAIPAPPRRKWNVRPRISIPPDLTSHEYARQCVEAAEHSRLNPFALHPDEYELLRSHLTYAQTTTYLNLRNAILRLWVRNPRVAVTRDEALGCAKDARWLDAAHVAFQWLVRRGYINYGCVEVRPLSRRQKREYPLRNRRTVVVVGAGMSGLGCARQLEALFRQHAHEFELMGEDVPKVIVLEGRARVGGRVYSKAFRTKPEDLVDRRDDGRDAGPPRVPRGFEGKRFTAEMGGMIITGFERGNPMNILVRGQLGLAYHALRSETTLYDVDGKPVDARKDFLVESLYNDILDRVSVYKHKLTPPKLIEGNKDLILEGRDPSAEGIKTIAQVEEAMAAQPHAPPVSKLNLAPQPDLTTVSTNKMTGRPHVEPGTPALMGARDKARSIGWDLKEGLSSDGDGDGDVDLLAASRAPGATLGSVVDEAVAQYLRKVVELTPVDFRLLNWHVANLEYSNAIGLDQLSLALWDVDAGNEWEGKHTMVVGGYQSVPRGLMLCPTPLDVRTRAPVSRICYTMTSEDVEGASSGAGNGPTARKKAMVECEDGTSIEADFVVSTVPLGVLKNGGVAFDPPLPSWKAGAIERMGFGVLNKVVLVYKKAFWDESRDIFGTLRSGDVSGSLDQADYKRRRGRFFQWLNVSKTSGLPVLIALMAGYAGFDTEQETDEDLISEATAVLRRVFGRDRVPARPVESLVTRWRSDRFAQGSYSSAGPEMQPDDYDVMARPVGENLFFAGEHTCGTHPATVHGAYLSGLRAASEVFEAMVGPIHVPEPLILPKSEAAAADMDVSGEGVSVTGSGNHLKRKLQQETIAAEDQRAKRRAALELELNAHVVSVLGDRPPPPHRGAGNAYLIFSKDHFEEARKLCEEARRGGPGGGGGSNSSNAKNDVGRTGDVATAATNDSSQTPSEASVAGSPGPSVAATTIRNASPSNGGSSSGKTTPSHHNRNHHHHNRPVGPNDVRLMTSRMWRALTPAAKQPYEQRASEVRAAGRRAMEEWRVAVAEWERRAAEERAKWIAALDPAVANDLGIGGRAGGTGGLANGDGAGVGAIGSPATPSSGRRAARLARAVGSYAEDSDSDIDMYDA